MNLSNHTELIRQHAVRLGFDAIGFSPARRLVEEESRFEEWLRAARNGTMTWMENNFDKRLDPTLLVPGARSVVSVLMSYNQPELFKQIVRIHYRAFAGFHLTIGKIHHTISKMK